MHCKEDEVLRVSFVDGIKVICTAGADGNVIVWAESKPAEPIFDQEGTKVVNHKRHYHKVCTLGHGEGQVYVCERLHAPSPTTTSSEGLSGGIITAADNMLYLWDLGLNAVSEPRTWTFQNLANGYDKAYGGPRNEENMAFIFDAKSSNRQPEVLVVALSDGTVRVVDISEESGEKEKRNDMCINVASTIAKLNPSSLGGAPPHVTMVALSKDDEFLMVCLGDGKVGVFFFEEGLNAPPYLVDLITAHTSSCFGAAFLDSPVVSRDDDDGDNNPDKENKGKKRGRVHESLQCVTWSSDGTIALWNLLDLQEGNNKPLVTLPPPEVWRAPTNRLALPSNAPVYCCHPMSHPSGLHYLACGGGSGKPGLMGTPLYLVTVPPL